MTNHRSEGSVCPRHLGVVAESILRLSWIFWKPFPVLWKNFFCTIMDNSHNTSAKNSFEHREKFQMLISAFQAAQSDKNSYFS